jgi:hypothetical protein
MSQLTNLTLSSVLSQNDVVAALKAVTLRDVALNLHLAWEKLKSTVISTH